jgi:hypothetical protein
MIHELNINKKNCEKTYNFQLQWDVQPFGKSLAICSSPAWLAVDLEFGGNCSF